MTTSPAGPAGVFDRVADTYDAVGVPWFRPIAERLVAELAPRPGERALDVGCGRGAALAPLARLVGPQGRAVGIDLAPRMVQRTAADLADLPWVEVRVGDATAPALPPASFDLVASSLVLFFLPEPGGVLRQWVDLLVPGGRLGVTTFGAQDPLWRDVDEVFTPYLPDRLKDARTSGRAGPFASDAGVESLLTNAGLVDVRTVATTVHARFRDVEHLVEFTWSHGQRAMWEAVPVEDRDRVRAEIGARVAAQEPDPQGLAFAQEVRHTLGRRPG